MPGAMHTGVGVKGLHRWPLVWALWARDTAPVPRWLKHRWKTYAERGKLQIFLSFSAAFLGRSVSELFSLFGDWHWESPTEEMENHQHITSTSLPHCRMVWAKSFYTCMIRLSGSQVPSSVHGENRQILPTFLSCTIFNYNTKVCLWIPKISLYRYSFHLGHRNEVETKLCVFQEDHTHSRRSICVSKSTLFSFYFFLIYFYLTYLLCFHFFT